MGFKPHQRTDAINFIIIITIYKKKKDDYMLMMSFFNEKDV